jgi:Tfp pilus assembly protein PilO
MKLQLSSSNRLIVAMLGIAVLAVAFWMLLLAPKRDEASKLDKQVAKLEASLAQHQAEVDAALEARKGFPEDYQQLVVLGKAVPSDDDTASLLVQLNRISDRAGVRFQYFALSAEGGGGETPAPPPPAATTEESDGTGEAASLVSPTEVAASTLPLGASIGPAGLAVMPYTLKFTGDFFTLANFIKGLDSLVKSENEKLAVDGRLITVNGFSLAPDPGRSFPALEATFSITTFLTPPEQSVTAGATPTSPAPTEATPASTTTGGTP